MSGDMYENDKQNIVADCVLCKEQIELECDPYFEIGAIYHHAIEKYKRGLVRHCNY